MKAIRRTKIRFEQHELKFIRFTENAKFFCQTCQSETEHLPFAQMALMLGVSEKTVFRLVEIEEIHSTETIDGKLLICTDSAINFGK